jgi:hypothetical protein
MTAQHERQLIRAERVHIQPQIDASRRAQRARARELWGWHYREVQRRVLGCACGPQACDEAEGGARSREAEAGGGRLLHRGREGRDWLTRKTSWLFRISPSPRDNHLMSSKGAGPVRREGRRQFVLRCSNVSALDLCESWKEKCKKKSM